MSKTPLLIIGSSGHAKVIIDIAEKQDEYKIIGLIDSFRNPGEEVFGYKVLGNESVIDSMVSQNLNLHLFIAIGDNAVRHRVFSLLKSMGINLPFATLIHPSAVLGKNVVISDGVAVMAGCIINTATKIGSHVIINTASSVDHDCTIDDFASIAPGATLGGTVFVGKFSVISIGASVKHGITIGDNSIIGAGAVVINDIANNEIHIGVPAKRFRNREHGEKYL